MCGPKFVRRQHRPRNKCWHREAIYDTPSMPQLSDHTALRPPLVSQFLWGIT